jgi:hypothetical protein
MIIRGNVGRGSDGAYEKVPDPPLSRPIAKLSQCNYYYLERHEYLIICYIDDFRQYAIQNREKIIMIDMPPTLRQVARWKNRSKDSSSNSSCSKKRGPKKFTGN